MRVAFLSHYSSLYGANRSLLNLIEGLKQFDVKSFVLCPQEGQLTQALEERKVPFFTFPFRNWLRTPGVRDKIKIPARVGLNLATLPLLALQVKKFKPDIIYTNSSVISQGALIAEILRKPHVWHVREFGWLDYQCKHIFGEKVFKYWLNRADAVIAISNAVKEVVLNGVHAKTYVIYNGVISRIESDAIKRQILSSSGLSKNYKFAIVGAVSANKGQEQAIRALAHLKTHFPNTRLLVVGSGGASYFEFLQQLSVTLGVQEQVEFWGYVSNPFDAYLKANAVLMCSRYEAMGRVTAEAMAAARPVIGYNSTGTAELIEDGVTGLLYSGDYKDLAHCMKRFIENPKLAQELGINGWEKARREFTIELYAKRVYEVLQKVLTNS